MTDAEKLKIAISALHFYARGTDLPGNHVRPEGWTADRAAKPVPFGDYAAAALAVIEAEADQGEGQTMVYADNGLC
ncbi:MAG: hypothetical protein OEZ19_03975 [Paracoccaceae bacterium]|nr:hypothetical protein [Paracoccaceae bacterium]